MLLRPALLFTVSVALAACAGNRSAPDGGGGELVGLLQYSDPENCDSRDGCGPEFGVVNGDFTRFTPVYGKLKPEHHNLVVRLQGRATGLDRDDAAYLGSYASGKAFKAKRYRLLSSIPYHGFLVEHASTYTSGTFGCDLLWDKTFQWREDSARVQLVVRMTDTLGGADPAPYVELTYDGQSGHLVEAIVFPEGSNPCTR